METETGGVEDIYEIPEEESGKEEVNTEDTSIEQEKTQEDAKNEREKEINKYYSSYEQVNFIANALGANTLNIHTSAWSTGKSVIRFEHNQGESIKVAVHPSMSEYAGNICLQTIDHVMGLINGVNDNYYYEVVDYEEGKDIDIVFKNESIDGNGEMRFQFSNLMPSRIFYSNATVVVDEQGIYAAEGFPDGYIDLLLRYIILHETMHAFGFHDVYLEDYNTNINTTTILNIFADNLNNIYASTNMTPNDYKNMIALYAKPSQNLEQDIEVYKQMVDAFTQDYYKNWMSDYAKLYSLPTESIKDARYTFERERFDSFETRDTQTLQFELITQDDKYYFKVANKDGEVLESTMGEIKFVNLLVNSESGVKEIPNAMAILENFESRYIFPQVYGNPFYSGNSNLILYNVNGKGYMEDSLGLYSQRYLDIETKEMLPEK